MTNTPVLRRPEALEVSDDEMLAIADPSIDPDEFDVEVAQVFNDNDVLPNMPAALKGSKFYVPEELTGDGPVSSIADNPMGPRANHELSLVYDCQGRPQAIQKAKLRHYLTKPCLDHGSTHRAFYRKQATALATTGASAPIAASIPCKAKWKHCRKMFHSNVDRDEHFRNRHRAEFQASERERETNNTERLIAAQERTAALMERLLEGGAAPVARATAEPERVPFEPDPNEEPERTSEETSQVAAKPDDTWPRQDLMRWLARNGFPGTQKELMKLTKADMLTWVSDLAKE